MLLGLLKKKQGGDAGAVERNCQALAIDPRHRRTHLLLGRQLLSQGRVEDAGEQMADALAEDDREATWYPFKVAEAYARTGHPDQVLKYLDQKRKRATASGDWKLLAVTERSHREWGLGSCGR